MSDQLNPFMSIESSQEYVNLLVQAIDEAAVEIDENIRASMLDGGGRRLEALQLVAYTLKRLRQHIATSRRLLNNLKVLRNLILGEHLLRRPAAPPAEQETAPTESEIYV
jgi:hypothetical protein